MNEIEQGAGVKGGFRRLRIWEGRYKEKSCASSGGLGWRGDT